MECTAGALRGWELWGRRSSGSCTSDETKWWVSSPDETRNSSFRVLSVELTHHMHALALTQSSCTVSDERARVIGGPP